MSNLRLVLFLLVTIVVRANGSSAPEQVALVSPRVFLLDGRYLSTVKHRLRNGDRTLSASLERLESEAKKALSAGPFSVAYKGAAPPSGDKRDYMSQAPYFWPNPKNASGLPYVRRDGERNPEINKFPDHRSMNDMAESVETLALAYYFSDDEAYAARAAHLLRVWFFDPSTRMNPHFQFAQAIQGVNSGRGIGLIESRAFTHVVDAAGLLAHSKHWTADHRRALQEWFRSFLHWMLDSENGQDECAAKNNHGTFYDIQTASYALFVEDPDLASSILRAAGPRRIARQIEPDGRQPLELVRTKAWSYSVGNLQGLLMLARLGENVGVDLWSFQTSDHRSIRKAIEYLAPFALTDQKWPHQELGGLSRSGFLSALRQAAWKYDDSQFRLLTSKLPPVDSPSRMILLNRDTAQTRPTDQVMK